MSLSIAVIGCISAQVGSAESLTLHDAEVIHTTQTMRSVYDEIVARHAESLDVMVSLNEIPAPPFGERSRALRLAQLLESLDLDEVELDAVGNVVARREGQSGARTVAVIAHIDTVFPAQTNVTVKRDGSMFHAPGIGDNARGLALMVDIAAALQKSALTTDADVLFIGSVGEEGLGDLRGVRALFGEDGPDIDSAIVIDGGILNHVVTSAVGSNRYRVTFRGKGGHSYGSFGRAHPHQALASAIYHFTDGARAITETPGPKATYSVGRIGGGTSINSIPFESWMEVDMRSVDPKRLALLDAALRKAIQQALTEENHRALDDSVVSVDIESVGRRPAGEMAAEMPLVQRAIASLKTIGVQAKLVASSTDANLPMSLGIPAVTISRGGISRDAHALTERWEDAGTDSAASAAALLVIAEAGLVVDRL
ncbi:MAG: M20/M25/M40 family metallo-hydrolase [Pseudomonadota bacterium]